MRLSKILIFAAIFFAFRQSDAQTVTVVDDFLSSNSSYSGRFSCDDPSGSKIDAQIEYGMYRKSLRKFASKITQITFGSTRVDASPSWKKLKLQLGMG